MAPRTKNPDVQRNLSIRKNLRVYHGAVWYFIRDPVVDFLHRYRQGFEDIVFEADGDCADFLSDMGLRHTAPSHAHRFADAIAWANNRNMEPKGVKRLDIAESIIKRPGKSK